MTASSLTPPAGGSRARTHLAVAGASLALAIGITFPLVARLGTHVPMPAYLHAEPWRHVYWAHLWSLWLAKQQASHWPPPLATALIYYPVGVWIPSLTQIASTAAFAVPLQSVLGLVAVGNVIMIGGLALAAYLACLLAYRVTADWPAALVAGAIFAGAPIVTANLQGHLYVISGLPCLPLYLLCLLAALDRPRPGTAIAAAAAFSISMLAYWYYAVFLALFTVVIVSARLADARNRPSMRRLAAAAATFAAVVIPVALAVLLPFAFRGNQIAPPAPMQSSIDEMREWSVDLVAFFLPAYDHWLAGPLVRATRARLGGNFTLQTAYLGYTTLALAAVALVRAPRSAVRAWAMAALLFFVLALGPYLHVGGTERAVPLLLSVIHAVPPISGVRDLSMYVVPLMLCLALLAAIGLRIASSRRTPGARRAIAAAAFALVAAEYAIVPFPLFRAQLPSAYAAIASDRDAGTVLELPLSTPPLYEFYQAHHGRPMVAGYLNRVSPWYEEYAENFPVLRRLKGSHASLEPLDATDVDAFLRFFHVRWVVIHRSIAGDNEFQRLTALVRTSFPARLVTYDDDAAAYRVDGRIDDYPLPVALDFSPDRPDPIITMNVSSGERREGLTAAWGTGTASSLWINLPPLREATVTLRVQPFVYAGAPPQTLTLSVNGRTLDTTTLHDGWGESVFRVPGQALASGMNRFDLAYRYCGTPADLVPDSRDRRCLAVAFDAVRIAR